MAIYNVYMPASKRVYNAYMPAGKRIYNIRLGCTQCNVAGNIVSQPNDMSNWFISGTATIELDQAISPDCTQNADKVTLPFGGSNYVGLTDDGVGSGSGFIDLSFWIKKIGGPDSKLRLAHPTQATLGRWDVDFALLSDDWELLTSSHPAVNEIQPWQIPSNNLWIEMDHFSNTSPVEFYAWCWAAVEV